MQVSGYLQVLLASIDGPVVLEAAAGILALAKVADRVLAAAPVLAIGAFMDLWDHDSSSVSHAQIMEVVCANLDVLQVMAHAAQHRRSDAMLLLLPHRMGHKSMSTCGRSKYILFSATHPPGIKMQVWIVLAPFIGKQPKHPSFSIVRQLLNFIGFFG